jgi:hypothetical protein
MADHYIHDLLRRFARATRALSKHDCYSCLMELDQIPLAHQQSNHRGYWGWWAELTMNDSSTHQYVLIMIGTAKHFFPFTSFIAYRQSERSGQLELWSLIGWAIS